MSKPMYLLFVGEGHRPDGGKWDLAGIFKTAEEAKAAIGNDDHVLIIGVFELVVINRTIGGLMGSSWVET